MIQGYVDELSVLHVRGWAWDTERPERRLAISSSDLKISTLADRKSEILVALGIGDAHYAFSAQFSLALSEAERAALTIFADGHALEFAPALVTTPPAPRFQGYLDALSRGHAAGWLRDLDEPDGKFIVEAWLDDECLASAAADRQTETLTALGIGAHGFTLTFPCLLTAAGRERVEIRVAGYDHRVEQAPALSRDIGLIGPLEIRLIDETGAMPAEVLALALQWLPYVPPGGAVLSGAPDALAYEGLAGLFAGVALAYRDRLCLRTSLAHRAPPITFERIAKSMIAAVQITPPAAPDKFYAEQHRALTAAIARLDPAMRVPTLTQEAPNTASPFTATITPNGRITINEPNEIELLNENLTGPEELLDRLAG